MKRILLIVPVLLILLCCSASPQKIELSGVWSLRGTTVLTHYSQFSWGMNPVGIEYTAIDLGAEPKIAYTEYGGFYIAAIRESASFYLLEGEWADGQKGEIKIGVIDKDTIWFESMTPHGNTDLGKRNFYRRVPRSAKVNPIDPEKGP